MYNKEQKEQYIEENKARNLNLSTQGIMYFNRCERYERRLKKDISLFTFSEVVEFYKLFMSVSLEGLMVTNSQYKLYTDWCIAKKLIHENVNVFNSISETILIKCLNPYSKARSLMSRQELLDSLDKLINPSDKFIALGLFEGIGASKTSAIDEFKKLKLDMFNTNTGELVISDSHIIKFSDELYNLAKEATNTFENVCYTKNGHIHYIKLKEDKRIIKPACNAKTEDYRNIIAKRMAKIQEGFQRYELSMTSLNNSGRLYMINNIVNEKHINAYQALSDNVFIKTYGEVQAKKRFLKKFNDYIFEFKNPYAFY